jgi:hypothetical protein
MSYIFYESQRTGVLPRQRLAWRSDSAVGFKGPGGEDLSKGYLEAGGSYLKLGVPEAFIVSELAMGVIAFQKGYSNIGELNTSLDAIRWGSDYLISSYTAPSQFVAVVGNNTVDFDYYGPPEEKEKNGGWGPVCYTTASSPASDITGEAAAALAATAVVFRSADAAYSAQALTAAKGLYTFAKTYPVSYQTSTDPCLMIHATLYPSDGIYDKLAWAAAWLFYATNDTSYLTDARTYYQQYTSALGLGYDFGTTKKGPALHVLLYQLDSAQRSTYATNAQQWFNMWLGGSIPTTPRGLSYAYHWGAFRPALHTAFLALYHSQNLKANNDNVAFAAQLFNYGQFQVNYVLGASGRSWMVGFGNNYPNYVWSKTSYNSYISFPLRGQMVWLGQDAGPWTILKSGYSATNPAIVEAAKLDFEGSFSPQRFILYGAMLGAPLMDDSLVVGRKDYTYTEPTTDGNGGITGALAALVQYYGITTQQNDCGLDLGWTYINATRTAKSVNNTAVCGAPQTGVAS